MSNLASLFSKDLVFIQDEKTQQEVFENIGNQLFEMGIVKQGFTAAIMDREVNHPTGLDLRPVSEGLPGVAIPHTDAVHCSSKKVVIIKLNHVIQFKNMIAPDQDVPVKYLFMIINDDAQQQTDVLSGLMAFMTNVENMEKLMELDSEQEIYEFLYASTS